MQKLKNSLKFVGMILLIINVNTFPMRMLALEDSSSLSLKWTTSIGYLVLDTFLLVAVCRQYKKKIPILVFS